MPYHSYSSSWSGISVLLDNKSTLPFCRIIKQTILPNSESRRRGLSGRVPYILSSLTEPRLAWANNLYSLVSFVVVTLMTVDSKNNLSTHHLLPTTVVQLFLWRFQSPVNIKLPVTFILQVDQFMQPDGPNPTPSCWYSSRTYVQSQITNFLELTSLV